jgi:hypothetical protein
MNARKLGIICALLAAMPNLVGCESSRSQDYQFEKQVKRAQECRQLQDKLVGDQPLTRESGEEIANTMEGAGCTARLPSADAVFLRAFPLKDDSASVSKPRRPAERLREVRWQEDQTLDRRGPI